MIVPELIIKGMAFKKLRYFLARNFTIQILIECDYKSFSKTEAKTFVLILKKTQPISNELRYIKLNEKIESIEDYSICTDTFISTKDDMELKSNALFEIIRGRLSGKACKSLSVKYLHTTNMNDDFETINFNETSSQTVSDKIATTGDIAIARVGSRVLGKTNFVSQGSAVISDCIFSIRFKFEKDKKKFVTFWKKNKDKWINDNCTGTCAKHITMKNLSALIDSLLINNQ